MGQMVAAFQRGFVGRDVGSGALYQGVTSQVELEFLNNGCGNFILDGEYVGHFAFVTLGP